MRFIKSYGIFPIERLKILLSVIQPFVTAPIFLAIVIGSPPMWFAAVFATALWLAYFTLFPRHFKRTPFDIPIAIFLTGILLGYVVSPDKPVSLEGLITTLASISTFYGLVNNARRDRNYWVLMSILSVSIIFLLSAWYFSQGEQRILPFNAWIFTLAAPLPKITDQVMGLHSLGTLLGVAIPVVLAKTLFSNGKTRVVLLTAFFMLSALLFLSTSGAGLIGVTLALVFVLAVWKLRTLWITLTAIGIGSSLLAINYNTWDWPSHVFSTLALEHRIDTWIKTIALLKDYWFSGVGPGVWSEAFFNKYGEHWINAHNSYLQLWADAGFFGLVAALITLFVTLRLAWTIMKSRGNSDWRATGIGFTGSIIAGGTIAVFEVIITGAFEAPYYHYLSIPLLWIIAALLTISYIRVTAPSAKSNNFNN